MLGWLYVLISFHLIFCTVLRIFHSFYTVSQRSMAWPNSPNWPNPANSPQTIWVQSYKTGYLFSYLHDMVLLSALFSNETCIFLTPFGKFTLEAYVLHQLCIFPMKSSEMLLGTHFQQLWWVQPSHRSWWILLFILFFWYSFSSTYSKTQWFYLSLLSSI